MKLFCIEKTPRRISLKIYDSKLVDIRDIRHIRGVDYMSLIFTKNKNYLVNILFDEIQESLSEFDFIKINYNTTINTKNIRSLKLGYKRSIRLDNDVTVRISRRRLSDFKQRYNI